MRVPVSFWWMTSWYWLRVSSWRCQLFPLGKADFSFCLWPITDVFQLQHTGLKWSRDCDIIQMFSAVLHVVRDVRRFELTLVINEKPYRWRPVECHAVIRVHVFDRFWDSYIFSRQSLRVLRDSTHPESIITLHSLATVYSKCMTFRLCCSNRVRRSYQ